MLAYRYEEYVATDGYRLLDMTIFHLSLVSKKQLKKDKKNKRINLLELLCSQYNTTWA